MRMRSEFNDRSRSFNLLFRLVVGFILIAWVAIFAYWIVVGVILVKTADAVNEKGLKTVIETIWCGKEAKDCKLPSQEK